MPTLLRIALRMDRCTRAIGRATAWLLLLMVLVGAYNAIARSLQKSLDLTLTSNALLELQWYLFGLAFLFGAPYALRLGDHVRVDVLQGGLPRRGKLWLDVLGSLLFLVPFCACGVWLSVDFVVDSIAEGEWSNNAGGLPRWPIKPAIPLAFLLLLLQGLSEAIKRLAVLRGHATEEQVGLAQGGADDAR